MLLNGFEENHLEMVRMLKGVPGVIPERFEEASRAVRHLASLDVTPRGES